MKIIIITLQNRCLNTLLLFPPLTLTLRSRESSSLLTVTIPDPMDWQNGEHVKRNKEEKRKEGRKEREFYKHLHRAYMSP